MMYPLVLDLAVDGIAVTVTCRVLGFSKQAFYKWRANPVTQRDWDDAHLISAAREIPGDDPGFGYRFIADELPAKGITAGENRVARLCSQERIWSIHSKKRGLNRKARPPVHDDLVKKVFTAAAPNLVWLTDITEHATSEGKLYLCAIKDVYSNRIVGYSSYAARWAGSGSAATTPPWSHSSPCCRTTSWTGNAGPAATNSGWPSCSGSNPPTTEGAVNAAWANSRPSSLRQSNPSHSRPEPPNPASQLNSGQSRPVSPDQARFMAKRARQDWAVQLLDWAVSSRCHRPLSHRHTP